VWGIYNSHVYFVYILELKNGDYYSGFSSNLEKRVAEHEKGKVRATKGLRPVVLVYYSAFNSKKRALDFEKYLKSSSGFAFRNKRLI